MRAPDGAIHAARFRRSRYDLLHREHHVRGVPRTAVRAAAAAQADGAGRVSRPEDEAGLLHLLIFDQHHLRDRRLAGVRQGHQHSRAAHGRKPCRRAAVERHLRGAVPADDFDRRPVDTARVAGAESLHRRFLRREACRVRRREVAPRLAVCDFSGGEDPPHEALAVPIDHVGHALDFGRIEPDTYNLHPLPGSYIWTSRLPMSKSLPAVPASFYWTEETWGAALRCRPLEPVAQHLFTTRQLELPAGTAWQALAASVGVAADRLVSLNQVHGREVVTIRKGV